MAELIELHFQPSWFLPILGLLGGVCFVALMTAILFNVDDKKVRIIASIVAGLAGIVGFNMAHRMSVVRNTEHKANLLKFYEASQMEDSFIEDRGCTVYISGPVDFGNKTLTEEIAHISKSDFNTLRKLKNE